MKRIVLVLILSVLFSGHAMASNFEGKIRILRILTGEHGKTRIGIEVGYHDSVCQATAGWFAFEYDSTVDKGVGQAWFSALMTAYVAQKDVVIIGTGTCDFYQVEGVYSIDLK